MDGSHWLLVVSFSCHSSAFGERVTVEVTVIGEEGEPVEGATVAMSFLLGIGSNYEKDSTNSEGKVKVTNNADFGVSMTAMKEGYYHSSLRTGYGDQNITLLLREKRDPIGMYAKSVWIYPPVLDQKIGYDLQKGDYVAPYGSGSVCDLIFNVHSDKKDAWNFVHRISVDFANPQDGLVPFYVEHKESAFKSAHHAPANGYKQSWDFERVRRRGSADVTNFDRKRNYYFRVRTTTNEDGEILSAHYGKIYGEFPDIVYYFNPTPNDRNVEFDWRKNLFRDLDKPVLEP